MRDNIYTLNFCKLYERIQGSVSWKKQLLFYKVWTLKVEIFPKHLIKIWRNLVLQIGKVEKFIKTQILNGKKWNLIRLKLSNCELRESFKRGNTLT